MSEKTEEPTHKRLRDAREKGDVANTKDVSKLLVLGAFVMYLPWGGPAWWASFRVLFEYALASGIRGEPGAIAAVAGASLKVLLSCALPLLAMLCVAGIVGNVAQTGFLIAPEKLTFSGKKLNVIENAKNLMSVRTLADLGFKMFYIAILSVVIWLSIRDYLSSVLLLAHASLTEFIQIASMLVLSILRAACMYLLVLVAVQVWWERRRHMKQMRMSKDEVKREFIEQEGNPHVKGQRKSIHRELVEPGMLSQAGEASAYVVNPTHFAVGIRYERDVTPLPLTVAKGEDDMALKLIGLAVEKGIPVIRDPVLARALYSRAELHQYVPDDLLVAVAHVLRIVERLREEQKPSVPQLAP